ncbi:hypothetical protein NLL38_00130 [Corynebacterium accolens]|jgi:hypothetical protein|uniref:hypothetical protein n=1 Tax=Corynebacterium accolens TaxID=38284 RepID=UPI002543836C|nr:hypothetical protein [Corynebacterium accolens]MDK4330497.1 hypothetical protein [Corynebacterium accolens]MDK8471070.1 hypothetical protein [Corynebacterium accolens]MDK8617151.1 hypothetical protein [Corynebacterium accolens]MDK8680626.1 hypothetical protein [Corynebacterium accolens]WKS64970.1 hypothetical protein NLL51_01640 [Corynebacterium accolens]
MKLISRQALVAGVTALSVTFAGTAVATAEENVQIVAQEGSSAGTTGKASQNNDSNENKNTGNQDKKDFSLKEANPDDIKAWIGVFTAAIGALGTLFAFADKYLDIEGFLKNFKLPF